MTEAGFDTSKGKPQTSLDPETRAQMKRLQNEGIDLSDWFEDEEIVAFEAEHELCGTVTSSMFEGFGAFLRQKKADQEGIDAA